MPAVIEVRDPEHNVVFHDLLSMLKEEGPKLVWSILDLEAVADAEKPDPNLLELEQRIEQSPNGLVLQWEDLLTLSESLFDVWNILIVAALDVPSIPRLEYGTDEFEGCEIAIEVFDSGSCRVYARNDAIIRRLEASYQDVIVTEL